MLSGFLTTLGVILAVFVIICAAAYGAFKLVCWTLGLIGGTVKNGYDAVRKKKGGI